jgi:hypothetical protein
LGYFLGYSRNRSRENPGWQLLEKHGELTAELLEKHLNEEWKKRITPAGYSEESRIIFVRSLIDLCRGHSLPLSLEKPGQAPEAEQIEVQGIRVRFRPAVILALFAKAEELTGGYPFFPSSDPIEQDLEGEENRVGRPQVFLSYAREDYDSAKKVYDDLRANGLSVWFDLENLLPGQKWEHAIEKAIEESDCFVTLLSAIALNKRGFVHKEMAYALDMLGRVPEHQTYLIPVRLEECHPSNHELRKVQWVDLFPDWAKGMEKTIRAIRSKQT